MEIITQSAQNTQELGQKTATDLIKRGKDNHVHIFLLYGQLGSGKTTFIQGMTKGLGLPYRIVSPTFIISKRYVLKNSIYNWFYHLDFYRINEGNLPDLGLSEIFANPKNLVVVEWAEKLINDLPKDSISIKFETINDNQRKITISYEK